jgi:hypothetical protein
MGIDRDFLPLLQVYTWADRAVKRLDRKRLLGKPEASLRTGDQFVAYVNHLGEHLDLLFAGRGS